MNRKAPMAISPNISVVIPAYKADFLHLALNSLTLQTDKYFEVIVADDASPAGLEAICNRFATKLQIRYVRFEKNLGGVDLVAHWTRAIECASNDWIWLLGDDDELESGCIHAVKSAINECPEWKGIWRVNVVKIDSQGTILERPQTMTAVMDAQTYILGRCAGAIPSFACEYIFSRARWREAGGFVRFPLAWCSDDATWIRIAGEAGIRTVSSSDAFARWRLSNKSISGGGRELLPKKLEARLQYMEWLTTPTGPAMGIIAPGARPLIYGALRKWFFESIYSSRTSLSWREIVSTARRVSRCTRGSTTTTLLDLIKLQRWIRYRAPRDASH